MLKFVLSVKDRIINILILHKGNGLTGGFDWLSFSLTNKWVKVKVKCAGIDINDLYQRVLIQEKNKLFCWINNTTNLSHVHPNWQANPKCTSSMSFVFLIHIRSFIRNEALWDSCLSIFVIFFLIISRMDIDKPGYNAVNLKVLHF